LAAPVRLAIDFAAAPELQVKTGKVLKALAAGQGGMWRALQAQGIFRGHGAAAKVAFLYTGQGSQYVNMLAELRRREPIVAATFDEADAVMTPLLGKPLSAFVFAAADDAARMAAAEEELRRTAITQPAVLTVDIALTRLLAAQGVEPDFVMGHSLGEYGALVAAGSMNFGQALEAVSARGREMTRLSEGDPGKMLAVFAPLAAVEEVLASVDGYAVIANINSTGQSVVGGESGAVERAATQLSARGFECRFLPVSHAFHTRIIAGASEPLKKLLARLDLRPPRIPVVSNVTGDFYPRQGDVLPAMIDLIARQLAEPVQFVRGLETLYGAGARVFVEVGPKRALQGFVADVLGHRRDVVSLATNHPK
ncbi:MAG: acyltransferase domain-containing protein, partial [Thermoanaerobaculia bacterium]|nr:acyltransferase domain-containing protein [Thermoanaerobaculia bacterium]